MASPVRRKRGTPTVGIQVNIEPDVKDLLDRYAALSGLPQWAVIEAAIRAGTPGANGLPEGWAVELQPMLDVETTSGGVDLRRTA